MKKSIFIFLTGLLLLGLFVGGASAAIGGSGTEADPYTINSFADLKLLCGSGYASYTGDGKWFVLTTDITNDGTFTTIGTASYRFRANFDGRNHKLINFSDTFFNTATIPASQTIKNVTFENSNIRMIGTCSVNSGRSLTFSNVNIENSYLQQSFLTPICTSNGIVNVENVNVTNCIFESSCCLFGIGGSGTINISNISFKNCCAKYSSSVSFCISSNSRIPDTNVYLDNINIENCTVFAQYGAYGISDIQNSYIHLSNSTVKNSTFSATYYGGDSYASVFFRTYNASTSESNESINNNVYSYNIINFPSRGYSGTVTRDGLIYLRVINSASLLNDTSQSNPKNIGDTVTFRIDGQQGAAIYLDGNTPKSGYAFNYDSGGTQVGNNPLTASYSSGGTKNVSLTLTGWNGSSTVSGGTLTSTAYIKIPYTPTLLGSGTSSDPYQVGSNANLQEWGEHTDYYNNMYMIITADFVPATTISSFAGNLAGGNHTLTNARLPLFNTLGGTVNNLKFTNSIVSGNGILANTSSAAISNVTVDDCFVGGSTTGGLVGNATGSFTDCTTNHITVKGTSTAGGIAGAGNTSVTRCKVLNSDLLAPTTYGVCA